MALAWICTVETGCETMIEDNLDQMEYNDRVDYYKSRGCPQRKAEQGAYEDMYFEKH